MLLRTADAAATVIPALSFLLAAVQVKTQQSPVVTAPLLVSAVEAFRECAG